MAIKQPMQGPGHFQWNTGGWFGSQVGCTVWLLPTGLILFYQAPLIGGIWLSIFTAINLLGFWIWNRRDRFQSYPSTQMLIFACGIGGLLAIFCLDLLQPDVGLSEISFRNGRFLLEPSGRQNLRQIYLFLLIGMPAMMGWFALMERGGRKARAKYDSGQLVQSQPRTNG